MSKMEDLEAGCRQKKWLGLNSLRVKAKASWGQLRPDEAKWICCVSFDGTLLGVALKETKENTNLALGSPNTLGCVFFLSGGH